MKSSNLSDFIFQVLKHLKFFTYSRLSYYLNKSFFHQKYLEIHPYCKGRKKTVSCKCIVRFDKVVECISDIQVR